MSKKIQLKTNVKCRKNRGYAHTPVILNEKDFNKFMLNFDVGFGAGRTVKRFGIHGKVLL
jgi:hypothetical protein